LHRGKIGKSAETGGNRGEERRVVVRGKEKGAVNEKGGRHGFNYIVESDDKRRIFSASARRANRRGGLL